MQDTVFIVNQNTWWHVSSQQCIINRRQFAFLKVAVGESCWRFGWSDWSPDRHVHLRKSDRRIFSIDPVLFAKYCKRIRKIGDGFTGAQEQNAGGIEAEIEQRQHLFAGRIVEIDQQVSTTNKIQSCERSVGQ